MHDDPFKGVHNCVRTVHVIRIPAWELYFHFPFAMDALDVASCTSSSSYIYSPRPIRLSVVVAVTYHCFVVHGMCLAPFYLTPSMYAINCFIKWYVAIIPYKIIIIIELHDRSAGLLIVAAAVLITLMLTGGCEWPEMGALHGAQQLCAGDA